MRKHLGGLNGAVPVLARSVPPVLMLLLLLVAQAARAQVDVAGLRRSNNATLTLQGRQRALIVRDRGFADKLYPPTQVARPGSLESADALVRFCVQRGIDLLFLNANDLEPPPTHQPEPAGPHLPRGGPPRYSPSLPTTRPSAQLSRSGLSATSTFWWQRLNRLAHRQGIRVHALIGDANWIYDVGPAERRLDAIAGLGRGAVADGFDGVLLDFPLLSELVETGVRGNGTGSSNGNGNGAAAADQAQERPLTEPEREAGADPFPLLPLGAGNRALNTIFTNRDLLRHYLDTVRHLRRYLADRDGPQRLAMGVTTPAWLEANVLWNRQTKAVNEHLADTVEYLVVHNLPGATVATAQEADRLLRYAATNGKRVYLRIDLGPVSDDLPELATLQHRDELYLERLVQRYASELSPLHSFGGIALNDYQAYRNLVVRRDLERAGQWALPVQQPLAP